jgi:hypothetical protein
MSRPRQGWPGDPDTVKLARANPDSIDDVTNHYANFIDTLPARPVIIGHSFGHDRREAARHGLRRGRHRH